MTHFTIMAEVDASKLFGSEEGEAEEGGELNVNWLYCREHANFEHQDSDACEFILHIGGGEDEPRYADTVIQEMRQFGCTEDFIQAYDDARQAGAVRVLFYV